jgi:hypothetical protein
MRPSPRTPYGGRESLGAMRIRSPLLIAAISVAVAVLLAQAQPNPTTAQASRQATAPTSETNR